MDIIQKMEAWTFCSFVDWDTVKLSVLGCVVDCLDNPNVMSHFFSAELLLFSTVCLKAVVFNL